MPEPIDVDALIADAKLPRRVVAVCTRGDLQIEAQRLVQEIDDSEKTPTKRMVGQALPIESAEKLQAVRDQMKAATVEFIVEAMVKSDWRSLKAAHPLKDKPTPTDAVIGADSASLFEDAIPKSIVSVTTADGASHEFSEKWLRLIERLPQGEQDKLGDAVYVLNEEGTKLPFSSRAFALVEAHSSDSESPETSESPHES